MTEKLYHFDPACLEFDAAVVSAAERDGRMAVVLDRTAFYPGGGGQPADRGTIAGAQVVEVGYDGDAIVHTLAARPASGPVSGQALGPGVRVHGSVDAAHRRDFMEQHTGQHILSQALLSAAGLETVSVHFGDETTTIEVSAASADEPALAKAEMLANEIIAENRPVRTHEVDQADAGRFPLRRTPPEAGRLRIVEVDSFDWAACGGVHVASTGQIFLVKIVGQEKLRGHLRIHAVIGRRVLADYGRRVSLLQQLSRTLTCGEPEMAARAAELVAADKEKGRQVKGLHVKLAGFEADAALAAAESRGGALLVRRAFDDAGRRFSQGLRGQDRRRPRTGRGCRRQGSRLLPVDRGALTGLRPRPGTARGSPPPARGRPRRRQGREGPGFGEGPLRRGKVRRRFRRCHTRRKGDTHMSLARASRLSLIGAALLTAGVLQPPDAEAQSAAAEREASVPLTNLVLFTSGVGFFQHEGTVEGNARMELTFSAGQVNDLLKSLVLRDMDGGSVQSVTYSSRDPITRTLKSFSIDLTANPTLAGLLLQTRGEAVEVSLPDRVTGTIIGVERREEQAGEKGAIAGEYVTLNTQAGIRSIALAQVQGIRFLRKEIQDDLAQALAVLSSSHGIEKKTVVLHFTGTGKRRVRIGYILETPVWKTSYRLVLGEKEGHLLQGWAMVENTSDADWKAVSRSPSCRAGRSPS